MVPMKMYTVTKIINHPMSSLPTPIEQQSQVRLYTLMEPVQSNTFTKRKIVCKDVIVGAVMQRYNHSLFQTILLT